MAGNAIAPVPADGGSEDRFLNRVLDRIVKKGPPWARTTALVVALVTGAVPYLRIPVKYLESILAERRLNQTNPYAGGGIPDRTKTAPGTEDELGKTSSDNGHLEWHHDVKNENPAYTVIYDSSDKGFLGYKVFDSDGCMLISRQKGQLSSMKLIRNVGESTSARNDAVHSYEKAELPPRRLSEEPQFAEARVVPVQMSCLNPHPGQFRYWYGPSTDQCWVPVYRQFVDGCTHYQMFNRCNGVWEEQIHWTICNFPHRW
ncbi:MAG: hypothetical protein JWN74_1244 [Acidobacteriaceae bacterium]|nr:hypothetical protein [Acidobacteriaceae bacterium]